MRLPLSLIALTVPLLLRPASALPNVSPGVPVPVPISRLVANASQYIKLHPKEPYGYYTLARVHSIAFAESTLLPAPTITIVRGNDTVREEQTVGAAQRAIEAIPAEEVAKFFGVSVTTVLPDVSPYYWSDTNRAPSSTELYHLRESLHYYAKVTALAPKSDTYWLGYGWMLEQGIPFAARLGTPWLDKNARAQKSTSRQWTEKTLSVYTRSYQTKRTQDKFDYGNGSLSEVGGAILRLQKALGRKLTPNEVAFRQQVQKTVARIKKYPIPFSPIILPLGKSHGLNDLLKARSSVKFDLSGDGLGRRWPWVGKETGIVVWDPKREGKITSGRQLFGNVTWWIFWKDGYQALAALDNDGDGQLVGAELEGIAIWRDANGNGVSDAGEVQPISEWGIASLATRGTHRVKGMPANLKGATTSSGETLPTYDWVPVSLD